MQLDTPANIFSASMTISRTLSIERINTSILDEFAVSFEVVAVPEPSTAALVALGLGWLATRGRTSTGGG